MAEVEITVTVNGVKRTFKTEGDRSLLDVVRVEFGLTGTKFGCGEGNCAACTVLVNDKPVFGCLTPVESVDGKAVTTIEGLAKGEVLHPVQEAFLAEGAYQCGYCTSGMILATVALLAETPQPTDEQIVKKLNGHLCRCCGYTKILKAVHRAAGAGR